MPALKSLRLVLFGAACALGCAPSHMATESVFAAPPGPQTRTVEYGMLQTEEAILASDDGSFVMRPGEQFQTPFSAPVCPEQPGPDSYQQALQVGARPIWVGVGYMSRPLYGLLLFCDVPVEARGPASRSHLVRVPPEYVQATEGGRLSVVYEPITSQVSTQVASSSCTNTCMHANDGECDDGGPNSLYSVCTLGTDCSDCGARAAGASTQTETRRTPAWMLFLSRTPFPGTTFQQTPPTAIQQVLGTRTQPTAQASAQAGPGPAVQTGEGGIGAEVRLQGQELMVVQVLPGGGAAAAGLTQGDAILAVDGTPVGQLGGLEQATERLRGPSDSQVSLTVRRLTTGAEENVSVTRRPLR